MLDHISYTQISTYLSCPLKYSFQYNEYLMHTFFFVGHTDNLDHVIQSERRNSSFDDTSRSATKLPLQHKLPA